MNSNISINSAGQPRDGWLSNHPLFKSLTNQEVLEFQQWARDNYDTTGDKTNPVWHPVVRAEFEKIRLEREKTK